MSFLEIFLQSLGILPRLKDCILPPTTLLENSTTFAKLTALTEFRIGGNQFSGTIPDYIQTWTSLEQLIMVGSGFSGPIPSGIFSSLKSLSNLQISDLNGPDSTFPQLNEIENLDTLILRSCNINGTLPAYLGNMTVLKILDLSFNKLSGKIPNTFDPLTRVNRIYLTGNLLTGPLSGWTENIWTGNSIDLSYNNFTIGSQAAEECQKPKINRNLFASSSMGNNSKPYFCVDISACSTTTSLHINCGGQSLRLIADGNKTYDADLDEGGPASFEQQSGKNWAFSNTGDFVDTSDHSSYYTWPDKSNTTNADLYTTARVSAMSLTYYGYCLHDGNYRVSLHFAEIMFTDDKTFSSLGRRVFNVYIQGKLELENFDIVKAAGGVGKVTIQNFTAVVNSSGTLEIRFYWAGKGTTSIPFKSVYGPLISAISVDADVPIPSQSENGSSMPAAAVVGIVAAGVIIIILVFVLLWFIGCLGQRNSLARGTKRWLWAIAVIVGALFISCAGIICLVRKRRKAQKKITRNAVPDLVTFYGSDDANELQKDEKNGHNLRVFSYASVLAATNSFSSENKLGEGGFGPVYRGKFKMGKEVAVKRLSRSSRQGTIEFKNELTLISELQHMNLVQLLGCCVQGEENILIYEYMPNKSLDFFLFDSSRSKLLEWKKRFNIIEGITQGLLYLHKYSRLKIVHRDLKASNILLDENLNPKISDFGLARIFTQESGGNTTRIVGTHGYMSPEYVMKGVFSIKSDVYSFGILMLEIVSGRRNNSFYDPNCPLNLVGYAWDHWKEGVGLELLDPSINDSFIPDQVMRCIHVALLCVEERPVDRPTMSDILSMLTNESAMLPLPNRPAFYFGRMTNVAKESPQKPKIISVNDLSISDLQAR